MKLSTRLAISFLVILLVPVILGAIILLGFSRYETSYIAKNYGVDDIRYEDLLGTMQFYNILNRESYKEVNEDLEDDPDLVTDTDYLDVKSLELEDRYTYLLVRRGSDIVYNGMGEDSDIDTKRLPDYGELSLSEDAGLIMGESTKSIIKQIDVTTTDGLNYSVFIVTRAAVQSNQTRSIIRQIMVMVLVILVITAFALAFWLYGSFVNPLSKLSQATKNIKEGNLDFTMQGMDTEDEIGQLYRDFEEMRQRLADQAEERILFDKENKELISNISHDLKTPITAVKGYVEGIIDGVADTPEKMERYIRTIYNKTNDMDHLINELTFYSKIDTNRIPYTFDIINVVSYFNDCAEELEMELEAKKFSLEYENDVSSGVRIIADAEQLRRVINNIVSNSIKYMDKEYGLIRLKVTDVGDYVQVDMEDNGKGIAQMDLPHVFDRFYRADSSRSSSKGGSGIGLSIVKKIVEDHGGKIWVNSKEGVGTTMSFVIRKYQEVPM